MTFAQTELLVPYMPAGNWPMWETYGEAVEDMLFAEAKKIADIRAGYPNVTNWQNKLPLEHITPRGMFFRYVREIGCLRMLEEPKVSSEGEFGWIYTSPLHAKAKALLIASAIFSPDQIRRFEQEAELKHFIWLLEHRITRSHLLNENTEDGYG